MTKISRNSDKTQLVLDGSGVILLVVCIVTSIIRCIIAGIEFGDLSYLLAIMLLVSVAGMNSMTLGMVRQI